MTMTNEEICREYRQAKRPKRQIGILADLNEVPRRDIVKILMAAGEIKEAPKTAKILMPEPILTEEKPEQKNKIPDPVCKALFLRLDELEAQIRELENEYKSIVAFMGIKPGKGFMDAIMAAVLEEEGADASDITV